MIEVAHQDTSKIMPQALCVDGIVQERQIPCLFAFMKDLAQTAELIYLSIRTIRGWEQRRKESELFEQVICGSLRLNTLRMDVRVRPESAACFAGNHIFITLEIGNRSKIFDSSNDESELRPSSEKMKDGVRRCAKMQQLITSLKLDKEFRSFASDVPTSFTLLVTGCNIYGDEDLQNVANALRKRADGADGISVCITRHESMSNVRFGACVKRVNRKYDLKYPEERFFKPADVFIGAKQRVEEVKETLAQINALFPYETVAFIARLDVWRSVPWQALERHFIVQDLNA